MNARFRLASAAAFALALSSGSLPAQEPAARPTPEPRPADVASVDAIVGATYDVLSGPAGQGRDWDRMRSLFHPTARMIPVQVAPDGSVHHRVMTVEDYIRTSGPMVEELGFREREVHRVMERFGNVAHVFSTYEGFREGQEDAFLRGLNSIQLLHDGSRWWVVSILWEPERPGHPVPPAYLPDGASTTSDPPSARPASVVDVERVRTAHGLSGAGVRPPSQ